MTTPRAVTIFFTQQQKLFEVDCTEGWDPIYAADVTRYPVEGGSKTSDHRSREPVGLNLSGTMSDAHPYRSEGAYDLEAVGFHTEFEAALIAADINHEPLDVDGGRRGQFEGLQILTMSLPSYPGQGASVVFSLNLTKIDITTTQVRDLHAERQAQARLTFVAQQDVLAAGGINVPDPAGAVVVAGPEEFQRFSPLENRGFSPPQPAGGDLAAQMNSVIEITEFVR